MTTSLPPVLYDMARAARWRSLPSKHAALILQVRQLQGRLADSSSLTARLQREMVLVKAKAEALEFSVSEKDAEVELLRQRQERQDTQVVQLNSSLRVHKLVSVSALQVCLEVCH